MEEVIRRAEVVYRNLVIMLRKYRGHAVDELSSGAFAAAANAGLVRFTAAGRPGARAAPLDVVMVIGRDNPSRNGASIEKLAWAAAKASHDLLVVVPEPSPPAVHAVITELRKKMPVHVEVLPYEKFALVVPEWVLASPHRIMAAEEVATMLRDQGLATTARLPRILHTDAGAVWVGARVGDTLEIRKLTEVTGEALDYRLVIEDVVRV